MRLVCEDMKISSLTKPRLCRRPYYTFVSGKSSGFHHSTPLIGSLYVCGDMTFERLFLVLTSSGRFRIIAIETYMIYHILDS